jgi:hypothetical protein
MEAGRISDAGDVGFTTFRQGRHDVDPTIYSDEDGIDDDKEFLTWCLCCKPNWCYRATERDSDDSVSAFLTDTHRLSLSILDRGHRTPHSTTLDNLRPRAFLSPNNNQR